MDRLKIENSNLNNHLINLSISNKKLLYENIKLKEIINIKLNINKITSKL